MTFRLTCLLIFTLLLASPVFVSGNNPSTSSTDDTTENPTETSTAPPVVPGSKQEICPSGEDSDNIGCNGNKNDNQDDVMNKCTHDRICFRDVINAMGLGEKKCCGTLSSFCPATKMHAWTKRGDGFLYKYDADLSKDFWYRRQFAAASSKGVACPVPNSFTLIPFDEKKFLPVDWKQEDAEKGDKTYILKSCTKNSDCEEGSFCDAVWNPTYEKTNVKRNQVNGLDQSGLDGKSLRFCYKQPKLDENLKHVEWENGLKLCNKHSECGNMDEICHFSQYKYRNSTVSDGQALGICVHVDACNDSDAQKRGVLNVNSQACQDDASCEGAGVSKGNHDHDPHCRSYYKKETTRKVCCFEKNPSCRVGKAMTPLKNCTQMTDCTGDLKNNDWNTWCDDSGLKICCKDLDNKMWQCPDLATPLFNEPMCKGWTKDNINSGTCPKKGGRCLYGHCCPSLAITENGTKVAIGKNLYQTEFPCDPARPVPTSFSYAFCNPENSKLIIVGKFHENGDRMTKVSGKKCTINADCSPDASSVCVYENDQVHVCYFNPLRALRPPVSSTWKIILIISLVCGGVFMVISLICFVCYRSKSVFDKYKPKKKGKKGKGSGGKSSKSSKKGKKGGKKGKKGKKGEEGSTSSKSKKSKTKDTEKSEGTTGDGTTSSQMN